MYKSTLLKSSWGACIKKNRNSAVDNFGTVFCQKKSNCSTATCIDFSQLTRLPNNFIRESKQWRIFADIRHLHRLILISRHFRILIDTKTETNMCQVLFSKTEETADQSPLKHRQKVHGIFKCSSKGPPFRLMKGQ